MQKPTLLLNQKTNRVPFAEKNARFARLKRHIIKFS